MPRFYLHLHECGSVLEDFEGLECASAEHAAQLALTNARDVMMGDLRDGRLCLSSHISISDGTREVGRVIFRDAVVITGS
jgi:hypothetical protein